MTIVERVARFPYNFILRKAPSGVKKFFWNREFASGKWNFIDDTKNDPIYPFVEKHAQHGRILDLGCGPGNTANELNADSYKTYVGVDISDVALEKGRKRSSENGRHGQNIFESGDLLTYTPGQTYHVIMARESLYHVALGEVKGMYDRYSAYLMPNGVFIVKLITQGRYTPTSAIKILEDNFDVVEKGEFGDNGTVVLVFRPKAL